MLVIRKICLAVTFVATASFATASAAAPLEVFVNTSSLSGTPSTLAFDVVDGGAPSNDVVISSFSTNGVLGAASSFGDVTGTFPGSVVIGDTSFFNEYAQDLTLGTFLRFAFNTTNHPAEATSFPDAFSFFVLNPLTGLPLFSTSDPTGADALFVFNIGAASPLQIHSSSAVSLRIDEPTAVSAPSTALLLLLAGFAALIYAPPSPYKRAG